ncbi:fatty acid desaturase [Rhodobacteraceae bacterium F11138]|nr:fatty acid desaturase [Rhodobacteraceae bacterium F11138]
MGDPRRSHRPVEWLTLGMILGCYALWAGAIFFLADLTPVLAVLGTGVLIAWHASLAHEVLHGHPFANRALNEALMVLPLNLCIPYNRFRDLHLAHHRDSNLTDPYDDPESNYLDPAVWVSLPGWKRALLRANNTLLGRILLGPALGQVRFVCDDVRLARQGDRAVWLAWGLHLIQMAVVIFAVLMSSMSIWAYLVACYIGLALLKIRTFLEHQAHEQVRGRTVIIEDRGPLAFLFLNNNLHVVHHMNPTAPWYRLPSLYRAGKSRYQAVNDGYVYRSYAEVFSRYFWRAKDPVAHPYWSDR